MGMVGCFAAADAATIDRLKSDPGQMEAFLHPDDGDGELAHSIDVDKAWHGIHFILTGHADGGPEPLCWAVLGGEEVGEEVGYGPARILQPDQVRSIAAALIDEAAFKARFAPQAMEAAKIYPDVIWVRDGDEALEYLVENYRELVAFYRSAAGRGDGAVLWLS
jgi:Domain of unknown function (DUF1877)